MKKQALVLLFLSLAVNCFSEEKFDIKTELYPQAAHIGDPVHLIFKIFRPENSKLNMPDILDNFKGLEIKDFKIREEKVNKTSLETIIDYTLVSFKPDSYTLESVSFNLVNNAGESVVLKSEKIPLVIESLIKDVSKENDIRGPKPQLSIKTSWLIFLAVFAFSVLLIAVAGIILKKTVFKSAEMIQNIQPTPDEEALQRLEALLASDEMRLKNMKAIYTRLTNILRHYLSQRYSFNAEEMTSFECLKEIKALKLDNDLYEKIKFSLEKADLVKFAKFLPEAVEISPDIHIAKDIVLQTREAAHAP